MTRLVTVLTLVLTSHAAYAGTDAPMRDKQSLTAQIDGFHGPPGTGKTVTTRK